MSQAESRSKTAFVTGGTRGIGRAIAVRLAGDGYGTIIVNYSQDDASAAQTKSQVENLGAVCQVEQANLAFPAAIDSMFDRMAARFDRIDALVHCAALGAFKPLAEVKPNQWDLSMSINARSFLHCVQRCRPLMKDSAVVAISSLGGRTAIPNYGAIGPSKAALEASVRQLAMELGPDGIRVNAVAAGITEGRTISLFPQAETLRSHVAKNTPLGRIGTPEDVADVVAFLLSRDARWIQGQVLVVDGGYSLGAGGTG